MLATTDNALFSRNLALVKQAVHSPLDYNRYNCTNVNDNTNCYSHALGSTLPCIELYRIGAICRKKDIHEQYFSNNEVLMLLFEDFKNLDLKIEKSFLGDTMNINQYQIALFVKIYADNKIHDFHFFRNDALGWSEKWRFRSPLMLEDFEKRNYFPWNLLGIFKITK